MSEPAIHVRSWLLHTPPKDLRPLFHSVFSAGRIAITPDYHLRSWSHPGHDLLLCVGGEGSIRIGNRGFEAHAGDLIWADANRDDVSWPKRSADWEFYWVRADSTNLDLASEALGTRAAPILPLAAPDEAEAIFERMVATMKRRPVAIDAMLNAMIANLVAIAFEARITTPVLSESKTVPVRMIAALEHFRRDYARPWRVAEMAALAGYSPPQFHRVFRRLTGSSPVDWLRHERINEAKRRLAETSDLVQCIAQDVGYGDTYYFSRDFRKLVGVSPRAYRQEEQSRRP